MTFYIIFWVVGVIYSIFLGSTGYIRDVHGVLWTQNSRSSPWCLKISQWILNGMGAVVGWIILGYFIHKFGIPESINFPDSFNFGDFILGLVMFYGLNGKLPYILLQAPETVGKLFNINKG